MKILKYAAIALGALVVLAVLAVVALLMLFDPNDYKGQVQGKVREQTGRELSLPGKISLSLFPDIALEFGPALLGNATGFGSEPMLQLERVRLGVKLRPLFSKRVEVSSAEVIRPVIHLQVDKSGRDNWSDISEHMKQGAQKPADTAGSPLNVQIASLKIEDGSLSYVDARKPGATSLGKVNLTTGELADGRPVKLDLGFVYSQSQSQSADPLSADVKLRATLTADTANEHYHLVAPLIEVLARGSGFPKEGMPTTLRSPSLDVDLKQQTLDWPGLQADVGGAKLEATLKGSRIVDEPQLSGTLALAELSPREWLPKFGIALPVTSDATVLKRFAFRASFAGGTHSIALSNLDAQLDDSKLTGSAGITDLDSMAMQFDLQVNRLNADRYLAPAPAKPAAAAAKPAAGAQAASPPVEMPVEMLRALNMRGTLRVAQATFAGVQFSGMRVGLDAARGRVHLAPLEAGLYGGQYKGDINIDATALPRVSFNEQITGVDFAPLAKDWLETNKLSGRGNLSVKANASGKDSDAMLRTLNGSLTLKVDNGALEGKDILYEIQRARALLKKEPQPVRTGPERTAFSQLAATGTIVNGVVTCNDLVAATQVMRVNGKGSINLVAAQIDYRLDVALLKAAEGRTLPPDLADTAGLVVPVRITGALGDPTIRPDVEAMVKAAVQQKVDEKKKELEDKLRDQLGDRLKGLLGH